MLPSEPATYARALVTSCRVLAFASIFTWVGSTLINIFVTVFSFVIWWASTAVSTYRVYTGGSVLARLVNRAFIDICLTVPSRVLCITRAAVTSSGVGACAAVLARIVDSTFVYIFVAVLSLVSWFAIAIIAVSLWFTRSSMLTRVLGLAHIMSFITTYAKITCRRRFLHLVHVMPTAISRQDRDIPFTALAAPVEADLSSNHTVFFFRMLANQPPRSVSSTVLCWDTGIGNLGAGIANKLEPFSYYCRIPFVAFEIALP